MTPNATPATATKAKADYIPAIWWPSRSAFQVLRAPERPQLKEKSLEVMDYGDWRAAASSSEENWAFQSVRPLPHLGALRAEHALRGGAFAPIRRA